MKLTRLQASSFRSLRNIAVNIGDLNLFIGANASGKSTVLDALRFLHEGLRERDFASATRGRGGIINLPWKGEDADQAQLSVELEDGDILYEWNVRLFRDHYEFYVEETVSELPSNGPPIGLLEARKGEGWWWSGKEGKKVHLKQSPTMCALAAASADVGFPARELAEFARRWGFFDPHPFLLRRDWTGTDFGRFDPYGRNLAETLFALEQSDNDAFKQIINATQDVLGLPSQILPKESDDRFFFQQVEPGLKFPVHQMGVSSGTLRMLALMTALYAEPETNLIGIEEPENYVHPTAIASFVDHLRSNQGRVQFLVTTHSPLLLDYLDEPSAVRIVRRDREGATTVSERDTSDDIRTALDKSGFGLGSFYETQGFGAN